MAKIRQLKNPPITEAVVDLFAQLPAGTDAVKLASAQKKVEADYPKVKQRRHFESKLQIPPPGQQGSQTTGDVRLQGYLFYSADDKQIFQARMDGFSFNRLSPYTSWSQIKAEAMRLWGVYAEAASPEAITRLGLRYINHIQLRLPVKISSYLTSRVSTPKGVDGPVVGFLTRVSIMDEKSPAAALVTTVFDPAEASDTTRLTLDIEVNAYPKTPLAIEEAWDILEKMRDLKNRCFFGSLTEKAMEMFQ